MFRMAFEIRNPAFAHNKVLEVAHILKYYSKVLEGRAILGGEKSGLVYDANGDRIGCWAIDED